MASQESDRIELAKRVDDLEKQNRRFKQVGLSVLVFAMCAAFMAQAAPKRTVDAEEFVLHDASGRVRAKLFMLADSPSLQLMDEKGAARAALTVDSQGVGPGLVLTDISGKPRVAMAVSNDPTEGPGVLLMDSSGKVRMQLTAPDNAGLQFYDANGKARVLLQVSDNGPIFRLADANEQIRASMGVTQAGPGLFLMDANGKPQATLLGSKDGSWLTMYDAQGREVYSKP